MGSVGPATAATRVNTDQKTGSPAIFTTAFQDQDRKMKILLILALIVAWVSYAEGEPTYPDLLTVSSTGEAAEKQPESLGVYKKTTQTWSGRPVWMYTGRDDRFLFYNGDWAKWVIYNRVSNSRANIYFPNKDRSYIPQTGWQYADGGTWHDDHTLTVTEGEPTYPNTLTVYSKGGAVDSQPQCMGVYKRTSKTWSGRPVWKHTGRDDRFLFYHGAWFRWVIDDNVDNGPVYIQSKKKGQINIPPTEWQ